MPDASLADLAMFVRVLEHGGFSSAARSLGVPISNVSRAVARLEAQSGVQLLHRTTRTVKAPDDLATAFFADVIVGFIERYPLVNLEFSLSNVHANLVDEGFDVAIRAASKLGDSSLVARKLGEVELALHAAPAYVKRHGAPASQSELAKHACVVFRGKELARTRPLVGGDAGAGAEVVGRVGGDDMSFVRAIVAAGGGIGLLPSLKRAADEAAGCLVRVLPHVRARRAMLYLLHPPAKNVSARVAAFRDYVVEAFASGRTLAEGKTGRRAGR